jgi:DNA polymerase-3 subunit delta'
MPFSDIIGHDRPKAILLAALRHERLAHAYLFHGEPRIGKRLTAIRFAQAINCETDAPSNVPEACGLCRSCHQVEAGTHPDFVLIAPDREQANPQIKIEEIRALEEQMIYRPLVGRRRVVIIDDADRMTLGAANALLKTLEEPPGHSVLVLVTSRPFALPATIRSRCQGLRFAGQTRSQTERALAAARAVPDTDARFLAAVAQGRLGEALQTDLAAARTRQRDFALLTTAPALRSVTTLLAAAETLHREERSADALDWLAGWVRDLILIGAGGRPDSLVNPEQVMELRQAADPAKLEALLALQDEIEAIQRAAHRNLNLQLGLETVLLRLREAVCVPMSPPK